MIFDDATQDLLADLTSENQKCVAAAGGRGGRGNSHFATSTNRVPTHYESGTEGEERSLRLELKLLADVGLIGFPNVGKSTLIAAISSARPKIAGYPFTTLTPNLGVVRVGEVEYVVADIPGLIEGASEGKGLGHRFLRHIERTRVLVVLVDLAPADGRPADEQVAVLLDELGRYRADMLERPRVVVSTSTSASAKRCVDEGLGFALLPTWCIEETDSRIQCVALTNTPKIPIYFGEATYLRSNPFVQSMYRLCLDVLAKSVEERANRCKPLKARKTTARRAAAIR